MYFVRNDEMNMFSQSKKYRLSNQLSYVFVKPVRCVK